MSEESIPMIPLVVVYVTIYDYMRLFHLVSKASATYLTPNFDEPTVSKLSFWNR